MNYKKILRQIKNRPRVHGYVCDKVETRISPIHGLGLFALKDIKKGEIVAVWGGSVATKKEIKKFNKDIGFNYALELCPGFYLVEKNKEELDSSDFINHSCSPNCLIINKFVMITKRKIKKDEELTANFSNHKNTGMKFKCNCGSKNCKKEAYFN